MLHCFVTTYCVYLCVLPEAVVVLHSAYIIDVFCTSRTSCLFLVESKREEGRGRRQRQLSREEVETTLKEDIKRTRRPRKRKRGSPRVPDFQGPSCPPNSPRRWPLSFLHLLHFLALRVVPCWP
ncbi:hypothetical protein GGR54DRAFT_611144 [Hypoxylon sp. NC1633]|nr:hypothetical protein GGR54DRAFT_611144 [Hypoxylon sp. NC1633]